MLVWHDMAESRIGDLHKIANHYLSGKQKAEDQVMEDQVGHMDFGSHIIDLVHEYEVHETLE